MNLGSLLGFGGGNSGGNYQAGTVDLTQPVTQPQVNTAYTAAQNGLNQQNGFVNAINAMNPLNNQANVYGQQQNLATQLGAQNGVANQSNTFVQQQALANQLQQIASGAGPNPAQAALNQNTAANVANQASLMAGQRGSNANVGLIARQAGQQGAATQQQAVGQGATLQAQQSLQALSQEQAQQQALQQTAATQVAQQQAQQGALANTAANQVNEQASGINSLNQANQNEQQTLVNAATQFNNQLSGNQQNVNNVNAGIQNTLQGGQLSASAGLIGGAGSAIAHLARGGMVPSFSDGGRVRGYADGGNVNGPKSFAGNFFNGFSNSANMNFSNNPGAQAVQKGFSTFGQGIGNAFANFLTPSMTPSPDVGEQSSPDQVMNSGGKVMKKGGQVPGKAKVKGDSEKNDDVDAKLSPGEIVIPRSITMMKDAPQRAAAFVQHVLAQHKLCAGGMI